MPAPAVSETRSEQDKKGAEWVGNSEHSGPVAVLGCGVDTWKPCWYNDPDPDKPAARWFIDHPDANMLNGSWTLTAKIDEHTIGFDARRGLIWAEGHPLENGLAGASSLRPRYRRLCDELSNAGVPITEGHSRTLISRARHDPSTGGQSWAGYRTAGEAGVGRLDVTADFETPTSIYGLELFKALQAIQFANGRTKPYGGRNMWETIVIPGRNGREVLGRFYDKGLESKSAPRGRLLRAEDQRRFTAERRRAVESIDAEFLCDRWHRRFRHFAKATEGVVTVSDPLTACAIIQAKIESGELDPLKGERLIATVVLDYLAGNKRRGDRVTLWRRRKELRELGIVTDAGTLTNGSTEINTAEVFELANHPRLWE